MKKTKVLQRLRRLYPTLGCWVDVGVWGEAVWVEKWDVVEAAEKVVEERVAKAVEWAEWMRNWIWP